MKNFKGGAPILDKPNFTQIEGAKIYSQLSKKVNDAGILKRAYGYYAGLTIITFAGFFLSLLFIYETSSILITALWSVILVIFSLQIAGLFHDAGHRTIFKNTKINDIFGYIVSSFSTLSFAYWKEEHNMHHSNTNVENEDPDVLNLFVAFTKNKTPNNILERKLRKYQVYIYYPLGIFYIIFFRIKSIEFYTQHKNSPILLEIPIFIIGMFLWYIAPFLILPTAKAIVFVLISSFGTGFYLMNIFAPNHKGMPQIKKGSKFSFLEQQIITSRNVKSNWFLDIFLIGLNYQIEHHLFPNCPRNKLKKITPYVLEICRKYNISYSEVSLVETNKIILKELNQIAASV